MKPIDYFKKEEQVDMSSDDEQFQQVYDIQVLIEELMNENLILSQKQMEEKLVSFMAKCSDIEEMLEPIDPFYQYDFKQSPILKEKQEVQENQKISYIINEVISPQLIHFEKIDNFVEILEYAAGRASSYQIIKQKGLVSIQNQKFWCSATNFLLLRFSEFSLQQLCDTLVILHKSGFKDGLELHHEFLDDQYILKQSKIMKQKLHVKILRNYVIEQLELYANDIISKNVFMLDDMMEKINVLYISIYGGEILRDYKQKQPSLLISSDIIQLWQKQIFMKDLSLENLDSMCIILKNFNYEMCIDLLKVYPLNKNGNMIEQKDYIQNLSDLISIIMALFQDKKDDINFFPDYSDLYDSLEQEKQDKNQIILPYILQPNFDDSELIADKVQILQDNQNVLNISNEQLKEILIWSRFILHKAWKNESLFQNLENQIQQKNEDSSELALQNEDNQLQIKQHFASLDPSDDKLISILQKFTKQQLQSISLEDVKDDQIQSLDSQFLFMIIDQFHKDIFSSQFTESQSKDESKQLLQKKKLFVKLQLLRISLQSLNTIKNDEKNETQEKILMKLCESIQYYIGSNEREPDKLKVKIFDSHLYIDEYKEILQIIREISRLMNFQIIRESIQRANAIQLDDIEIMAFVFMELEIYLLTKIKNYQQLLTI